MKTRRQHTRRGTALAVAWVAALAGGCTPAVVDVHTQAPQLGTDSVLATAKVSSVLVRVDPALAEARRKLAERDSVPTLIQGAMATSLTEAGHFDAAGPLTVEVLVTEFAVPESFPKDEVSVTVAVKDAEGNVVKTYQAHSRSVRGGGYAERVTRVCSDVTQKALDQL